MSVTTRVSCKKVTNAKVKVSSYWNILVVGSARSLEFRDYDHIHV